MTFSRALTILSYYFLTLILLFGLQSVGFSKEKVNNYLNIGEQISFSRESYHLAWSNKNASYYQQEYIIKGDHLNKFKKMITVIYLDADVPLEEFVGEMIANLDQKKKIDPVINYRVLKNEEGDIILDFVMSEMSSSVKLNVEFVERNIYKISSVKNNRNQNSIVIFGASERAYGEKIYKLFEKIKNHWKKDISEVDQYNTSKIRLKK